MFSIGVNLYFHITENSIIHILNRINMKNFLKVNLSLIAIGILFLSISCNSTPEAPKSKEVPEEALVEEAGKNMEEEAVEIVEAIDQTAILESELATLEASLMTEAPSKSRSKAEAQNHPETPVDKCMRRCDDKLDKTKYPTQCGSAVNNHNDCVDKCQELSKLCNRFQDCIKDAKTEEEKKSCRQHYMENRPWND